MTSDDAAADVTRDWKFEVFRSFDVYECMIKYERSVEILALVDTRIDSLKR